MDDNSVNSESPRYDWTKEVGDLPTLPDTPPRAVDSEKVDALADTVARDFVDRVRAEDVDNNLSDMGRRRFYYQVSRFLLEEAVAAIR